MAALHDRPHCWQPKLDPELTRSDRIVLNAIAAITRGPDTVADDETTRSSESSSSSAEESESGYESISSAKARSRSNKAYIEDQVLPELAALNDPHSESFEPTVFTTWDKDTIPAYIPKRVLQAYTSWAMTIVRKPTDVVFVTHLIVYFTTVLPSACWLLFFRFSYLHGVLHLVYTIWCAGAFTLLMHNHMHQNGLFRRTAGWTTFDKLFPYILNPLMGHTWNSYYYHHKQMHHVEANGPNDLSSTLRYQRDSPYDFLCYLGRFLVGVGIELPLYFWRKNKRKTACKAAFNEATCLSMIAFAAIYNTRAAMFTLVLPLCILRIGLMVGNWGQHALVDEDSPLSDFRSSITLIDVASNRYCFNDGYHTSHHIHPQRHWRDHPYDFLKKRHLYANEQALTFYNIDYVMMTIRLLMKDYGYLADRLVPMGEQVNMSKEEVVQLLKNKTTRFSEERIEKIFGKKAVKGS